MSSLLDTRVREGDQSDVSEDRMAKEIAVQWSLQDKENAPANVGYSSSYSLGPGKAEAKEGRSFVAAGPAARPSRSKNTFGRLLGEVTREQKDATEHLDEKVAVETQCREAVALAMEWVTEDADCKMAHDLQVAMENEAKLARQLEVSRGESEALSVAIEERRRVMAETERRRQLEEDDAKRAAALLEEEEQIRALVEQDDVYAKRVHETLQDELVAEEMARQEEARDKRERDRLAAIAEADAKQAADEVLREMESDRAAAEKQMKQDFDLAHAEQDALDKQRRLQQAEQEKKDFAMAHRLSVKAAREEHRRLKALELGIKTNSFPTMASVHKQWEECEAVVEDVMDGICITLVLPFVRDLKTKACGHNRVELEAYRVVGMNERDASVENSQYAAEFIIEGSKMAIMDRDISYEYASDTGLLHIYIDKVRLDGVPIKDTDAEWAEQSDRSGRSLLGSVKNSFKRVWGKIRSASSSASSKK